MQPPNSDDLPELYTSYRFKLNFTRILGDHIIASSMAVKMEYGLNPSASVDEMVLAWNKIELWLESLNQCVVIGAGNPLAVLTMISAEDQSTRFANMLMLTPGEPTEEMLAYIFQAKLNALSEGVMAFGPVEIEAVEAQGVSFVVTGHSENFLPNMAEWMGEKNWFSSPWWDRDDGSIIDSEPHPDADLAEIPEWAYTWDFLQKKPQPSGVVISGRFKPRLVEDK